MASFQEDGSRNSKQDVKPLSAQGAAERRRAALAEIDNAKLSQVVLLPS